MRVTKARLKKAASELRESAGERLLLMEAPIAWLEPGNPDAGLTINEHLEESDKKRGRLYLEGIFQRADTENKNKRIYPRKIFERLLSEKGPVPSALKTGSLRGYPEHPEDGRGKIDDSAILVKELKLRDDGVVWGRALVLSTPKGKILEDLCRDGVRLGISSRGTGTVTTKGSVSYVNEDYELRGFDVVGDPSTPDAYPVARIADDETQSGFTEADESSPAPAIPPETRKTSQQNGAWSMSEALTKFRLIEAKVNELTTDLDPKLPKHELTSRGEKLLECSADLGELVESRKSLRDQGKRLQKAITVARDKIESYKGGNMIQGNDEKTSKSDPGLAHKDDKTKDGGEANLAGAVKDGGSGDGGGLVPRKQFEELQAKYDALKELAGMLGDEITLAEESIELMGGLIDEALAGRDKLDADLKEANEKYAALTELSRMHLQEDERREVDEAIALVLDTNPALERIRPLMERCETAQEVLSVVESLSAPDEGGDIEEDELPRPGVNHRSDEPRQRQPKAPTKKAKVTGALMESVLAAAASRL